MPEKEKRKDFSRCFFSLLHRKIRPYNREKEERKTEGKVKRKTDEESRSVPGTCGQKARTSERKTRTDAGSDTETDAGSNTGTGKAVQ